MLGPNPRAAHTANYVRLLRQLNVAPPRRRALPEQIPPDAIEKDYARELLRIVEETIQALAPLLAALPALLAQAVRENTDAVSLRSDAARPRWCHWCHGKGRLDANDARRVQDRVGRCPCTLMLRFDTGEAQRIQALLERANAQMIASLGQGRTEALALKFAEQTQTYQRIQLGHQVKAALGIDLFTDDRKLRGTIENYAIENALLIRDIPARIVREVGMVTTRAIGDGMLWPDLAKEIEKRFGYGSDRAALIARDQVGKLYGRVNAQRQQDLGVTRFVWHTVADERVRPEHAALDGQTFSYDSPPSEGLPGHAINCRCWAEPVLDDILDQIDPPDEQESGEESAPPREEPVAPLRPAPIIQPAPTAVPAAAAPAAPPARRAPRLPPGGDTKGVFFRDNQWTPERVRIHDEYLAKVTRGVPVSEAPTVYMTGGGPASGKSYALLNNPDTKIPKGDRAVHADPDAAKTELPEYLDAVAEGDVGAGSLAHEESAHMSQRAVREGLTAGHDVVYDSSGDGGIDKLSRKVQAMRDAGAKRVVANYATIDVEQAIARSDKRGVETGRFVPHDYLRAVHADVAQTSIAAMERGVYDELTIWDTGGANPLKVATYVKGQGITVHDQAAYTRYLERGGANAAELKRKTDPEKPKRAAPIPQGQDTQAVFFKSGTWAPERAPIHDAYVAKVTKGVPKTSEPTVYMTGGGPASGKSAALLHNPDAGIPKQGAAAHSDPDAAKAEIPEYLDAVDAGELGAASMVHEESSFMSQRALRAAIADGHDTVYDSTGDSGIDKLAKKVQAMREAGAKRIVAHYATIDVEEAIRRSDKRSARTGRFVPHDYLRAVHADVGQTAIAAMERGTYDKLTIWDTNGREPLRIADFDRSKGLGEAGLTIHHPAAYEAFRRRSAKPAP